MTDTAPNVPLLDATVELPDGRVLGVAEYGDPHGRPVLWFHATPGACHQIPPDAPAVARERGVRLIGVERPGTGRSSPHMYGQVVDWARDVRAMTDVLGIRRFSIIGLSGGGPYVLACAHAMPDKVVSAAVFGGLGPTSGPERAPGPSQMLTWFDPVLRLLAEPGGELFTLMMRPAMAVGSQAYELFKKIAPKPDRPVLARPEFKQAFMYDLMTAIPDGLAAPIHDLALFAHDWGFSLTDIRVPVRFWHGDADPLVPMAHSEHVAALVPGAELIVVEGGGHFSGYTAVEEVMDALLGFWIAQDDSMSEDVPPADVGGVGGRPVSEQRSEKPAEKAPAKKPAEKAPAKKTAAKKTAAKKTAKKTASKKTAEKTPAKKTASKKSTGR